MWTIGNSSISINNVWFVDGLIDNLLSISQFCDTGYDVMFDKNQWIVINKNEKSIVFNGKRKKMFIKSIFQIWLCRSDFRISSYWLALTRNF